MEDSFLIRGVRITFDGTFNSADVTYHLYVNLLPLMQTFFVGWDFLWFFCWEYIRHLAWLEVASALANESPGPAWHKSEVASALGVGI